MHFNWVQHTVRSFVLWFCCFQRCLPRTISMARPTMGNIERFPRTNASHPSLSWPNTLCIVTSPLRRSHVHGVQFDLCLKRPRGLSGYDNAIIHPPPELLVHRHFGILLRMGCWWCSCWGKWVRAGGRIFQKTKMTKTSTKRRTLCRSTSRLYFRPSWSKVGRCIYIFYSGSDFWLGKYGNWAGFLFGQLRKWFGFISNWYNLWYFCDEICSNKQQTFSMDSTVAILF